MNPTRALHPYEAALADAIGRRRRADNVSQATLAERAGMHVNTLGHIERGERPMTVGQLYALAEALGLEIGDLLPDSGSRDVTGDYAVTSTEIPSRTRGTRR